MEILKRFRLLIIKLVSIKGLVFILATVLKFCNLIDGVIWLLMAVLVISTRAFEKLINKLPNIK